MGKPLKGHAHLGEIHIAFGAPVFRLHWGSQGRTLSGSCSQRNSSGNSMDMNGSFGLSCGDDLVIWDYGWLDKRKHYLHSSG